MVVEVDADRRRSCRPPGERDLALGVVADGIDGHVVLHRRPFTPGLENADTFAVGQKHCWRGVGLRWRLRFGLEFGCRRFSDLCCLRRRGFGCCRTFGFGSGFLYDGLGDRRIRRRHRSFRHNGLFERGCFCDLWRGFGVDGGILSHLGRQFVQVRHLFDLRRLGNHDLGTWCQYDRGLGQNARTIGQDFFKRKDTRDVGPTKRQERHKTSVATDCDLVDCSPVHQHDNRDAGLGATGDDGFPIWLDADNVECCAHSLDHRRGVGLGFDGFLSRRFGGRFRLCLRSGDLFRLRRGLGFRRWRDLDRFNLDSRLEGPGCRSHGRFGQGILPAHQEIETSRQYQDDRNCPTDPSRFHVSHLPCRTLIPKSAAPSRTGA